MQQCCQRLPHSTVLHHICYPCQQCGIRFETSNHSGDMKPCSMEGRAVVTRNNINDSVREQCPVKRETTAKNVVVYCPDVNERMYDSCGPTRRLSPRAEKVTISADINHNHTFNANETTLGDTDRKSTPRGRPEAANTSLDRRSSNGCGENVERPVRYQSSLQHRGGQSLPETPFSSEHRTESKVIEAPSTTPMRGEGFGKAEDIDRKPIQRCNLKPSSPLCYRCGRPVYFHEKVFSLSLPWHVLCLRCVVCHKKLAAGSHTAKYGLPICQYPCLAATYSAFQYSVLSRQSKP